MDEVGAGDTIKLVEDQPRDGGGALLSTRGQGRRERGEDSTAPPNPPHPSARYVRDGGVRGDPCARPSGAGSGHRDGPFGHRSSQGQVRGACSLKLIVRSAGL
jgi:hypothetical protein